MTRKTFTDWYSFVVVTVDELGRFSYNTINVLGFGHTDCVNIAMQSLEPGQMLGSMERMGTFAEYVAVCGQDGDESNIWDDDDLVGPGENNLVRFNRKDDMDFIDKPQQ